MFKSKLAQQCVKGGYIMVLKEHDQHILFNLEEREIFVNDGVAKDE